MNRGLVFFLGIITGVLLTIAATFIINKSSSASDITMFNERGKMMDATSYTIIQTIDNNHGLAVGDFLDLLNPVLVLGNKDSHFYDGMEVKAGSNSRFYQVGTYRYMTKDEIWKTVPVVALMRRERD